MVRISMLSHWKAAMVLVLAALASACSSEGEIKFHEGASTTARGVTSMSITPGAQALAIESGKTKATGYHARLELNSVQGQRVNSGSGYSIRFGIKRVSDNQTQSQ